MPRLFNVNGYQLVRRQRQAYLDLADIYVPSDVEVDTSLRVLDKFYPPAPTYSSVPCLFLMTREIDLPQEPGRSKEFNIMTADHWRFPIGVDIKDEYLIRLRTPTRMAYNAFWYVEGNPEARESQGRRTPNFQVVLARRLPPAFGVTLMSV